MGETEGHDRPSFAEYWRRQDVRKPLVFVSQAPEPAEHSSTEKAAQEKAQRRRAQVRRAQLQHRARKAEYTRKLEVDVAQLRDATERIERRCEVLRGENREMRRMLVQIGAASVLPSAVERLAPVHRLQLEHQARQGREDLPSAAGSPGPAVPASLSVEKTVTLGVDEAMQQPCYRIVSPTSVADAGYDNLPVHEEDLAINFILALEHICWDHFHPSDFQLPDGSDPGTGTGHAMMASTFAAATAPEILYPNQKGKNIAPGGLSPTWKASGLTVHNLRLLASSITPGDVELTPVQGWFELVDRYGAELLLGQAMEALKREFIGVVKCPHFGAVIEREAFESVVARVMGETPLPMVSLEEAEG